MSFVTGLTSLKVHSWRSALSEICIVRDHHCLRSAVVAQHRTKELKDLSKTVNVQSQRKCKLLRSVCSNISLVKGEKCVVFESRSTSCVGLLGLRSTVGD